MKSYFTAAIAAAVAFVLSAPASAELFTNQFIEFQLPNKWSCVLEQADWVCQSQDQHKKREAIIVLAAKLKGDHDTLGEYRAHLEAPRKFTLSNGVSLASKPRYVRNKRIGGQVWVDSMHLESEISGFLTRYLATVKSDIGVLVTYSVSREKYPLYEKQLSDMVESLKVFHVPGQPINPLAQNPQLFPSVHGPIAEHVGDTKDRKVASDQDCGPDGCEPVRDTRMRTMLGVLVVLFMGSWAAFFVMRRRGQRS